MKKSYRVETKWPVTGWRWTPEEENLTLKKARQIKKHKEHWWRSEGLKARIIQKTISERIVK